MPTLIGKNYEVVKELRRGTWVTVYEARHCVLGRRTLIKWLNPTSIEDDELVGRLLREARLGASIDHPNIARIHEIDEYDNRPFIAIEWIEGEDLEEVLKREQAFDIPSALRLSKDLLSGLSAIHQAGVVHRDLSPTNVRITSSGKAKITDFGLATGEFDTHYTLPGAVIGTPGYFSPEQTRGRGTNQKSDLFSCGILIHEAITGTPLFCDTDLIATLKHVRNDEAPKLEDAYSDLPKGFDSWISNLLAKNPDDRFESAELALKEFDLLFNDSESVSNQENKPTKSSKRFKNISAFVVVFIALFLLSFWYIRVKPANEDILPASDSDTTLYVDLEDDTLKSIDSIDSQADIVLENRDNVQSTQQESELDDNLMRTPFTPEEQIDSLATLIPQNSEKIETPRVSDNIEDNNSEEEVSKLLNGWINIQTQPWADIYINGVRVGSTPGLGTSEAPPGQTSLTIYNPGFPPITYNTTVIEAETTFVDLNLDEFVGLLTITASPWAKVYIDDVYIGDTPFARPLPVSPGSHSVRLEHPDFGKVIQSINTDLDSTLVLHVDMSTKGIIFANP
jgi:serine/threonine protein kinase